MTEQQIPKQVPKNDYETVEGTTPQPYAAHEPRTVVHTRSNSDNDSVTMMTEIGDGTFVQWSHCHKCKNSVPLCTCPDGPVEPDTIARWRSERFAKSLNQRPEPEITLLPSILEWAGSRGHVVVAPARVAGVLAAAQEAVDMAYGDSNDDEIDGLRTALEEALLALGLEMPEIEHTCNDVNPTDTASCLACAAEAQAEEADPAGDEAVLGDMRARNLDDIPDDF